MGLNIIHPESELAHKYLDGLRGIEIGAASYQPFGLNTININTPDPTDRAHYNGVEEYVSGHIVSIHIYAEADRLPLASNSTNFLVASHVLEHCSSPINVLIEWDRVIRDGGYLFLIVPKREAPYGDQDRRISSIEVIRKAYLDSWTNEQAFNFTPDFPSPEFRRWRGHVWVFDLLSLCSLIHFMNGIGSRWIIVEAKETDDTDGTGHLLLLEKIPYSKRSIHK